MENLTYKKLVKNAKKRERKMAVSALKNPLIAFCLFYLILDAALIIFQLYWGVVTSLKTQGDFRKNMFGLPTEWAWKNFAIVLNNFDVKISSATEGVYFVSIWEQLYNTLFYCLVTTAISVLVPCCVGYVMASFKYKFNEFLIGAYWFSVLLPTVGTGASQMYVFRLFGLYDNLYTFSIISRFTFLSFSMLVFKAAFSGVSSSYREAGIIDGASEFTCMFRLALPMVYPYIVVNVISTFIGCWENYQTMLLYLPSYPTLAVGLYKLSLSVKTEVSSIMVKLAGCVMMSIPIVVLYWFRRSNLIVNLNVGGIKG